MKRRFLIFALAALTVGLLGSCSKINERIDGLDKRAYDIENKQIASVDQQVAAIKASIADLEAIRADVKTAMDAKTAQGEDITALQTADQVLEGKINDLRTYVDTELAKYASTEWANATFATLEKQAEILADIAALKTGLEGVDSKIDEAIAGLDSSMKGWVNDQLSAYYKKAEMDAKVKALQDELDALKAGGETDKSKIEGLETKLTELTEDLEAAKATIKTEYEAAITAAINENNGTINQTIQSKIDEVNATITALTGRVEALETTIGVLSGRIDAIEAMIQTVTIVPAYDDGSVESTKDGVLHLDIIVTPAEAVATLTKGCLKVMVNEVKTKAVDLDTVAVTKFKVDAAKGTITARADISSNLPVASGKALTIAVNVKNGISDYTTEFYPVTLSTESNVTITDGPTATNVTIKDDEDFPESSAGNIVVADGFKDTKPTSVSIPMPSLKVGGIGTVTFNEEATAKIKANAEGSTNVFFKVEDVTTTKPVPNADVVLEVTMKTVDENGKEVFNEENAAGEVTIQIPMDENVAYVNSVTLVNDAGEPIEGGVVPGSEEIENGILTFKVNHFSKYAVDYVTKADFVAVTGVKIEPVSFTFQVGENYKLVATIAPEDATNKKVTWSSSDTTKVKVDDTGKITAVAFGQATITVTTKDGGKTATCTVKVSETKTMADILKTTTGIPESQNLTPPANAWVNSTDPDCKAFVGIDAEGDTLFVILKEGSGLAPLGICMDDDFEKIDDNTYQRVEPSVGTFTIKMAEGKFTSLELNTNIERIKCLNGTYSAPVFKAVYDTNGGANTLTFYYDANDHSGEGIVYEGTGLFNTEETTAQKKWGYNDKRGEIKSVVITESVKNYSGLTSTACMFNNMTAASYISGAEYLYVSNVTNMMAMFWNFGSNSSTLSSVPDVKDWNTESVTNMQNMFTNYGAGSKGFNAVPDVGKWNTASVTNMTNMFWSYGNKSEILNAVPDVKEWNTASVTNMNSMFESYGESSNNLNKVPDVSKWNTDRVTDMGDMFLKYGYTSTALNTVPDVSGWNTINVTTMANMFQNYGYSSTALSTVPNVSNWKTGKVTSMTNMFNGYGYKSTNISCVLDLSGWDLSKITSGDDVFKFKPSTFDVTIPAKTGEKSNEGGKWYYGNGTNHIAPPAGKTFTLLALKGVFSVSATKKVRFSKGNLQATYNSSASAYTWGFAANQYDYIGNAAGNTTIDSQTNGAVVDLFGWSTASTTYGISTSRDDKNYSGDFVDWGKAIDDKGTWSTLSKDEWTYLINTREVNGGTKEGKSYQRATINSDATSVYGMILYPDNFTSQTSATSYTSIEWTTMEENGCVFLPAAGNRSIAEVGGGGGGGGFWSSTALDKGDSYLLIFKDSLLFVTDDLRSLGYSVRLVTEVK